MKNLENLLQKLYIRSESKGVLDEENRILAGVVGSTGVIDRQGESLNPMGWILDNYTKNPVIMWAHDYRQLPVGKAERVWIEDGKLMFNVKFADTPMAKDVFDLFKGGFLNAFSVGFIPREMDTTGEYTYAKQELLELSVVPVPANPEALLGNKEMSAKMKSIEEALKEKGEEVKKEEKKEEVPAEQKQGRVLSKANETKLRNADGLLNEVLAQLDNQDEEKAYILTRTELKEIVTEAVKALIESVQIVKEVTVEKIVEVEKKTDGKDDTTEMLKGLQKELKTTDKGIGLSLRALNTLLSIKSSTIKGGDTK